MGVSEELREALLNLAEARNRESQQRQMAEALLEGLSIIVFTSDLQEMFKKLFDVMQGPLGFEAAFVLSENENSMYTPEACSNPLFSDTHWKPESMFVRVMKGQPVSVFDTDQVHEWKSQPDRITENVKSALHFPIYNLKRKAMFICTHFEKGHFSKDHLALAKRFSILAVQAMQKLESQRKLASLEKKLETEAELAALNKRLVESEKKLARAKKMEALGTLAGGVAHDLNNVLSGIVSYPDLILMDLPETSPLYNPIKTIQKSGFRAVAIVQDLLTLARRGVFITSVVNLNEIIFSYLDSPECFSLKKHHPGVELVHFLEPDLLNIQGSPVHLSKSVMNLVSNAAESMPEGGVVTITTETAYLDKPVSGYDEIDEGDYVVLRVKDTGIGISTSDIEKIFEPFYTKKLMGRSGTGLGMAVVWGTVKDHNGFINVESTENQGTTFSLYFPVTREKLSSGGETIPVSEYRGNGERILVIDDVLEQREIATGILKKLGYNSLAVSSGEAAVDFLQREKVDLLMLDMIMDPGIDGLETYRAALEINPRQKAIIASGYSETDRVREALHLGVGIYIKKPYTIEKIGLAVKKVLK